MAHYLVGEDNSSLFKKRTTWDILVALSIAEDGDVIELAKDYCPYNTGELKKITIEKSITIRGYSEVRDGTLHLTNTLPRIFVKNKAQVTLEKLTLRDHKEKSNILHLTDNSVVSLESVIIENLATEGENFPIVFINEQSSLYLKNTTVKPGTSLADNNLIYANHSTLDIVDSSIFTNILVKHTELSINNSIVDVNKKVAPIEIKNSGISIHNSTIRGMSNLRLQEDSKIHIQNTNFYVGIRTTLSEFSISDSRVENHSGNAFSGVESTVNMEAVTLKGGLLTEENRYPCAIFTESNVELHNVDIIQPNYTHALNLVKSKGKIGLLHACSINVDQSTIHFETAFVRESFFLYNQAQVTANRLEILGLDNGKLNFYANKRSSFHAEEVFIGRETKPNIRLERTVDYRVTEMNLYAFDEKNQKFKENENGYLIPIDKELDIDYFGEIPALQQLQKLIGIENIKEEVESFIAVAELNKRRIDKNLESTPLSLHSLFLGNPGTGKTSVARLIGKILFEKGVVSKEEFIEVSRSDLVGSHIGHTAIKTRKVLEAALGGVLFIDEAYTLSTGSEKDFGIEAIHEILTFMENHRSNIVIIFAGYTKDMEKLLEMNEGLRSRVPNHFEFPDYSIEDLVQIGLIDLYQKKNSFNEEIYRKLIKYKYDQTYDHSNGRWVRNINDLITRKMALRLANQPDAPVNEILDEDLIALMN